MRTVFSAYAVRPLFSAVCGRAASPGSCRMASSPRFTTVAETRKPFAWHVSRAVVAMTFAAPYDSNFSVFDCAFAADVSRQVIAEVAATSESGYKKKLSIARMEDLPFKRNCSTSDPTAKSLLRV